MFGAYYGFLDFFKDFFGLKKIMDFFIFFILFLFYFWTFFLGPRGQPFLKNSARQISGEVVGTPKDQFCHLLHHL